MVEFNDRKGAKTVKSITECELPQSDINSIVNNNLPFGKRNISKMKSLILRELNKILLKLPETTSGISSEVEVVDTRLEAETNHTRDVKCNTVISIPSAFCGELFPAVYPAGGKVIMSVIPRDCKIVRKSDALPELFNLKLVEVNYKGKRWLTEYIVFTMAARVCSMRQGMCGSPVSTGVWWQLRMGARIALKQVKASNQCAQKATLGKFMNHGAE